MTTPAEAARRYRESSTTPRLVAGCSRPTMTLAGLGALKVGGGGCLVPVCSGFRGAGGGWVGGLDGGGWREMRVGTGVKVRVPPVRLLFEAGPKGLRWAWEGRLRVLAMTKIDPSWGAFAIFSHPIGQPPHPPHRPDGPQAGQAMPPAHAWCQPMGWGGSCCSLWRRMVGSTVCSGAGSGGWWCVRVGGWGWGWREMRVGIGVKVRVPPGLLPVETGPKGLGSAC